MQNSSFLFNYDSDDSSAHSSSSYQLNSQGQPEDGNVEHNALNGSSNHTAQSERHALLASDSSEGVQPENERDGSANADTVVNQHQAENLGGTLDDEVDEILGGSIIDGNIEEDTAELLRDIVDASDDPILAQEQRNDRDQYGTNHIDARTVWQNALAELALQMPSATYDTWMRDTSVIAYEDGEFIIGLPNAYARDWIMNRLQNKIKRLLGKLIGRSVSVTFRVVPITVVDSQDAKPTPLYDPQLYDASQDDTLRGGTAHGNTMHDDGTQINPSSMVEPASDSGLTDPKQHSVPNQFADNLFADELDARPPTVENQAHTNAGSYNNGSSNQVSARLNTPQAGGMDGSLRAGYTFDTFIVGSHNQLAHAAAASIADGPGQSFNPLFIYGGVGLGKTHLLHAVGNLAASRGSRVLYCTSEQFTNELITSIRGRGTEAFRSKYRQVDVLLIDDIQFIAGKESTQEEFFHTFNHLHTAGRQVVLSSDRTPKALGTLEERLRSRFEGGLLTDISQPDFETRVAILQSKANKSGIRINSDVLMLIAERVDSNIRELEGALNRMVVQAKLFSNTLDLPLAESILRNLAPQRTPRSPAIVIGIVAEHFHLTSDDMTGRSRTKEIANARQIAMYLLREENGMSLPSIGDHLGGRDHSTVRHGVEKINKDLERDEQLRREIMALRDKVYSAPEA